MRYKTFLVIFFFPIFLSSQKSMDYNGFRVSATNFKEIKQKSKKDKVISTFSVDLFNTGRFNISNPVNSGAPNFNLVFDSSIDIPTLKGNEEKLDSIIRKKSFKINTGKSKKIEFQFVSKRNGSENNENVTFDSGVSIAPPSPKIEKNLCPDLVIDNITILKRRRNRSLTFSYTVKNIGNAAANLRGNPNDESDDAAVRVFLNSTPKISKGSTALEGEFFSKPFKKRDFLMKPGESYIGKLKISLTTLNKHNSLILLEVDPFFGVYECNEQNNFKDLRIEVK
jgi:hypothetical protein